MADSVIEALKSLSNGIPFDAPKEYSVLDFSVPHSPKRTGANLLSEKDRRLALANALRYFPKSLHTELVDEFSLELKEYNHIYMHRFRPRSYEMRAYPYNYYPTKTVAAAAAIHMIMNNLDPKIAQYPHELVTYGGNGSVFQNWAQYHLVMKYLCEMGEDQTLVLYSGHSLGLFPSPRDSPRIVITNGMTVFNYSKREDYDKMQALGVTQYGQMTAGSWCYIGPQGIVHGTTLTVLNAGRKYLNLNDLSGTVFITSGLGGMSGAQGKAAVICGAVGIIAEINPDALNKRFEQGWIMEKIEGDLDALVIRIRRAIVEKTPVSVGFLGNIVDVWERLVLEYEKTGDLLVHLGSDQTSLHNPYNGGYYPVQLTYQESLQLMVEDPPKFKLIVQESLRRHVAAINKLSQAKMRFWDYGNSFLLEASRANADVWNEQGDAFRYPSYVEDIMGDIFSLGFGPFRWICTSGLPEDLENTDKLAAQITKKLSEIALEKTKLQYEDNLRWITQADEHKLVVGSQARILYSDAYGRTAIALAFNEAIRAGTISGPIVLSRDHHDVSGTDSPYRETSNIRDGSQFTADMAVQNFVGGAFRGCTWVALHNGGGTGWGEAVNGGFGLVLDGSTEVDDKVKSVLFWDVNNGIARRAWAQNENALETIVVAMKLEPKLVVTIPVESDASLIDHSIKKAFS